MRALALRLAWLSVLALATAAPACRCDRAPPGAAVLVHEGGMVRDNVRIVALGGDHIYYAEGEHGSGWRLKRVPTSGGTMSQLAEVQRAILAIVPTADTVFFATEGAVLAAPVKGGAAKRLLESSDVCGSPGACALAVDDTHVYVTMKTAVVRFPRDGGAVTAVATGFTGAGEAPAALAVDDRFVYLMHSERQGIHRALKAGGPVETLVADLGAVSRDPTLQVSDGFLYWLAGEKLQRAPVAGGAPVLVAVTGTHASSYPGGFRVAGDAAYFTRSAAHVGAGTRRAPGPRRTDGEGGVMKVPVAGGTPVWVVRGMEQVYSLDVGPDAVFFAADRGQVLRHPL